MQWEVVDSSAAEQPVGFWSLVAKTLIVWVARMLENKAAIAFLLLEKQSCHSFSSAGHVVSYV